MKGGTLTIGNKLELSGWFLVAVLSGVLTSFVTFAAIQTKPTARTYPIYRAEPIYAVQAKQSEPIRKGLSLAVVPSPVITEVVSHKSVPGLSLKLIKSKCLLQLCQGDSILAQYSVAIGRNESDHRTPTGYGRVEEIGDKPIWRPGPTARRENPALRAVEPPYNNGENPNNGLGEAKIVLSGSDFDGTPWPQGFYIHGTNNPESIGTRASLLCVRMLNDDVITLASKVTPGMPIVIVEDE